MRPTKTIETIAAYHEAGHAVVAHFQRIKVKQVTLMVDVELGILGYTHTGGAPKWVDRDPSDRVRMNVERYIVMCFAESLPKLAFVASILCGAWNRTTNAPSRYRFTYAATKRSPELFATTVGVYLARSSLNIGEI
jgi:hypothetical protein